MDRPSLARLGRLVFLLAAGLVLSLAVPLLLSRAEYIFQKDETDQGVSRFEQVLLEEQARRMAGRARLRTFPPHAERAPFGGPIAPRYLQGAEAEV